MTIEAVDTPTARIWKCTERHASGEINSAVLVQTSKQVVDLDETDSYFFYRFGHFFLSSFLPSAVRRKDAIAVPKDSLRIVYSTCDVVNERGQIIDLSV